MHFIEKFDRENIDGQHLRPSLLAILLETVERENFDRLLHDFIYCLVIDSIYVTRFDNTQLPRTIINI